MSKQTFPAPGEAVIEDDAIQDAAPMDANPEESVDLLALALAVLRGKRTVLYFTLGGALLAAIIAFQIRPLYTAEASFVPPTSSQIGGAAAALASQLSGLGSAKGPGDLYVGILGSRTVEDALIAQFDLQKVYRKRKLSDAEKDLARRSKFSVGTKDSIVTISVEDWSPQRARDLAAAYMHELTIQNERLALTEASQRRLFFQQQLEHEKNALADAEVDLAKTEEKTGFIAPVNQTGTQLGTLAETRAEIASREVQLAALSQGATEENPDTIRVRSEIANLQGQLKRLQSSGGEGSIPTSKVPALQLEYVRKQREVRYHDTLFEMLARQFEAARLDESRNAPVLQVLDAPVVPDKKSWPPRMLLVLAGAVLGALSGIVWVILRERIMMLAQDPEISLRLAALREAASLR